MIPLVFRLLKYLFILVLPFFLLVRGSIYIHNNYNPGAWFSLGGGVVLTVVLLFTYMTFIYTRFSRTIGDEDNLKRRLLFALTLVVLYCGYGLFFISSDNVKNPALKAELTDLHPILRMGVSTFILLDKKMIITDASRIPEDYKKMGLKRPGNSLHYRQNDGYAYAFDLRTNNRNEIRNALTAFYFRLLGFRTLRHIGTDDHLHISLRCHYRENAR